MPHLKKPPSTSELIDWLRALIALGLDAKALQKETPLLGCLLKNEQDMNPPSENRRVRGL
jgi:hypothetical protein